MTCRDGGLILTAKLLLVVVRDVASHSKLCPTHTVKPGLGNCSIGRPAIVRDAVDGSDGSSSISASLAMDEDRLIVWIIYYRHNPSNLFVCGRAQARHRYVEVAQTGSLCFLLLSADHFVWAAQVDYGFYAELRQLPNAALNWLRAAVELIAHLLKIRKFLVARFLLSLTCRRKQQKDARYTA